MKGPTLARKRTRYILYHTYPVEIERGGRVTKRVEPTGAAVDLEGSTRACQRANKQTVTPVHKLTDYLTALFFFFLCFTTLSIIVFFQAFFLAFFGEGGIE